MKKELFSHEFDANSKISLVLDDGALQLAASTAVVPHLEKLKNKLSGKSDMFNKILAKVVDLGIDYLMSEEQKKIAASQVHPQVMPG